MNDKLDHSLIYTYCESWIAAFEKRDEYMLERQQWAENGGRDTLAATYAEVRRMNNRLADFVRTMVPDVEVLRARSE